MFLQKGDGAMSIAKEDIYQLVDGTLDSGLSYVGSYLETKLGQPIIIADSRGLIHYPYFSPNIKHIDHSFNTLLSPSKNDFFYSKLEKCLYYRISCSNSSAYIIVKNLPETQVLPVLSTLKQTKLAVKCYFSQVNQTMIDNNIFEQAMYEYLFGRSVTNLADILTLGNYLLDMNGLYYVDIMEVHDIKNSKQWSAILSYSRQFLKRIGPEAFMASWEQPGIAVYIFPYETEMVEIKPFKATLEKNYPITASFGRGTPHPLYNLRRSCDEARIALHYPNVMGIEDEIQSFSELGTFTPLFSQDLGTVKLFIQNTLEPILEHDEKNECSLLATLIELVNSNFSLKETAKNLYIHVNTLYYRISKIEQLLTVDLSLMSTRFNLYSAIMSWSLLHTSGLWD